MIKTFKTRVLNRYDTESNWNSVQAIPLEGEIIIYKTDEFPKIKVGDGTSSASQLDFINDAISDEVIDEICSAEVTE